MEGQVEHEICANCKKEIPHFNYVMHMAHCARNLSLCKTCKDPIPKNQMEDHQKSCKPPKIVVKKPSPPPTSIEKSVYYSDRKAVEDKKAQARKEQKMQKLEKFVESGQTLKGASLRGPTTVNTTNTSPTSATRSTNEAPLVNGFEKSGAKPKAATGGGSKQSLLPCKYCDLELPKLDLEEHENYCGSRTDKCLECGELVMYKYKQIHMDSNHGFLKLKDEPGPRPSWDSSTQRSASTTNIRPRLPPLRSFSTYDTTSYSFPSDYTPPAPAPKEKGESYKEISRRLDCPAPQPPRRRRNPPTELTIPCEFCDVPVPHEELILHETGCRPDLARFQRRKSPEPDDYFTAPAPSSPEVELPCEFCADMIPASQLLRHQATCN